MVDFDIDMHVKKVQIDKPTFAVFLKKKTIKEMNRIFIVVKKKEHFLSTTFNGVGFWSEDVPNLDPNMTVTQQYLDSQQYEEVWIPYENIDYIKSLVYIKR